MKKALSVFLCAALVTLMLGVSAFASESQISVRINGTDVSFADAAPQIVSSRTFIPFRAVFKALGFADGNIGYDNATRTVSAVKSGKTVSLVIGENKVSVTENGKTTDIATDVSAFIDANLGRTYVPARFVAQALGCNVGWDASNRCVLIDDVDALLNANTAKYTLMDEYLAYSKSIASGSYSSTGTVSGSITSSADGTALKANFSGTVAGVTSGTKNDVKIDVNTTGSVTQNGQSYTLAQAGFPAKCSILSRADSATGTMAIKSDALMQFFGSTATNTWVTMNQNELGISSLNSMMQLGSSAGISNFHDYLRELLSTETLSDRDVTGRDVLAAVNAMYADSVFKESSGVYSTSIQTNGTGVSVTLALKTSGGAVTGYTMTMKSSVSDASLSTPVTMDVTVTAAGTSQTMQLAMDLGAMTFSAKTQLGYKSTTSTAVGAIEAGAKTISFDDLLNAEAA